MRSGPIEDVGPKKGIGNVILNEENNGVLEEGEIGSYEQREIVEKGEPDGVSKEMPGLGVKTRELVVVKIA